MACVGGYYWAGYGNCYECPVGFGRAPDSSELSGVGLVMPAACGITCNQACKVYQGTAASNCNKCDAGHYLSAPNTCTMCPVGFGKPVDIGFPLQAINPDGSDKCTVTCAEGCRTCSGPSSTECLNCQGGYFYAGAGTCTHCETGKGKAADTLVLTVGMTSALACTATCHYSCLTCS